VPGPLAEPTSYPAGRPVASMRHRTFGEGPPLAFLMGWGNRLDGENEQWFVDRLVDAGFAVQTFELPTDVADFHAEYVVPVRDALGDPVAVVGHSTGGLVAAHLRVDAPRVYLSPWWGIFGEKLRHLQRAIVPRLPTRRRIVPVAIDSDREEVGELLTDEAWRRTPKWVSPAFVRAILRGQDTLPPARENAVVFCSLRDTVVSLKAIGERFPPERIRLYDGGHELYSSTDRERHARRVVAALPDP